VSVGALLYPGLTGGQPEPCDSCNGNGGTQCFVCEGTGTNAGVSLKDLASTPREARPIGASATGNPRECRACKGAGLILCKKCKGSGYMRKM